MDLNRRSFLKAAGIGSVAFAGACSSEPEALLYSLVEAPDDMVTGKAAWYASTCRECPAGCGLLAKNREGRVVKLEGNPLHPINRGNLCIRGQSALQGIYNPDRIQTPLLKTETGWEPIPYPQAQTLLGAKAKAAAQKGPNRVRMMSEVVGESLVALFHAALGQWHSQGPVLFETYAYESLKSANAAVFDINGLPSYRMDQADLLVSMGADFLETWLSPVEYARKFTAMHAHARGGKGLFLFVGPYQSLTGANADCWLPCRPGGEVAVALGCLREAVGRSGPGALPGALRTVVSELTAPYTKPTVLRLSGMDAPGYDLLATRLAQAQRPLVLGTGTGASGPNAYQTQVAVNLLNLVLDPSLARIDFANRHRVEAAASRLEAMQFFQGLGGEEADLLLLNNVNPVFSMPSDTTLSEVLKRDSLFVVCFSNFMDETARLADMVFPTRMPLESWDTYGGWTGLISTLQPTLGTLTPAPQIGDVFVSLITAPEPPAEGYKAYLLSRIRQTGRLTDPRQWVRALEQGGCFTQPAPVRSPPPPAPVDRWIHAFRSLGAAAESEPVFLAAPSLRFFDGRGANRPWLTEIPDPITKVAWQTPVRVHPETLERRGIAEQDLIRLETPLGRLEAPAYAYEGVIPGVFVMEIGQGHEAFGRYAEKTGLNPLTLLSGQPDPISGGPRFFIETVSVTSTGKATILAATSGSRIPHGRAIALSVNLDSIHASQARRPPGYAMDNFPLSLPLAEGYDPKRDVYPPHDHAGYRWSMAVDLDRCIGCAACAAACYAENNIGIVGEEQVRNGREMAWLSVERYQDPERMERVMFLPMLCQHCDNAPCEPVCPVYAPHHNKEGINNQIYNRCIGTRFCSQNCPYKVRRFNWFDWQWPSPMNLQLNPDVTVRGKGVMEKCSFCIQRIKAAHTLAKNENRKIRDGEVLPACVQTCPTGALVFGNLMDTQSRVRKMAADPRAYQVMGYLNTKPAVIYLKKVVGKV